jgi:uncharacterized protein
MSGGKKVDTKNKVLRCPRDHSVMKEENKNSAFIDICQKCGGMYFDQGEMFGACGVRADPSYWDRNETNAGMKDSPLHCSRCDGHMLAQDVKHGDLHVEIDRCAHCGGIWLDKGEIEKIFEISDAMKPVVDAEAAKAKADLDKLGDVDFSPPGLISRFLSIFGVGKAQVE